MRRLLFAALVALQLGCATAGWCGASESPLVLATIAPLARMAREVVGPLAQVAVILPPGACPETWRPDEKALARGKRPLLVLALGADFERPWIEAACSLWPGLAVAATAEGLVQEAGLRMRAEGLAGVWLSPSAAAHLAANVEKALAEALPGREGALAFNAARLRERLLGLDREVAARLAGATAALAGDRPDWAWFARRYGLDFFAAADFWGEAGADRIRETAVAVKRRGLALLLARSSCPSLAGRRVAKMAGLRLVPVDPFAEDFESAIARVAALAGAGAR